MYLSIDLQDDENKPHKVIYFLLEDQATISELKDHIRLMFHIAHDDQRIFNNNDQRIDLVTGSLENAGIRDNDTLILKHALLSTWRAYLFFSKCFKNKRKGKFERTKLAHRAIAASKKLKHSGFFITYINFHRDYIGTIGEMLSFVDRMENALEESAITFFSKMYPSSKIDFEPKPDGSQAGIMVMITCNDEKTKYYMKTYHHSCLPMTLEDISNQNMPDLRKMFAYRVLELIGVGPVVFFPYYAGSTYCPFIATEEVCEFEELYKLEDVSLKNKIVVEAFLIVLIFGLRNLHEGNIGSNKDRNLCIIDFFVPDSNNFVQHRIFDAFMDCSELRGLREVSEILSKIGHEERMKYAKDALPRWNRISSITSNIIDIEKNELQENELLFETNTTNMYAVDNYLRDIKLNYAAIYSAFQ